MKLLYKYVFIICIFLSFGQSQKIQPEITNKKQRLIILPSEKGDDESSIQYQLVEIVADEATQLGRYNVFNRQDLKKIFEEQALYMAGVINDSSIIEFGQIAGAKEAMLIKLIQFDQHGIPKPDEKEEETNFFDVIVAIVDASSKKEKEEPHADNIQTVLTFSIKTIDVETGQTLNSHYISAEHTGGGRGKSLKTTLRQARRKLSLKLRQMYKLTSQVIGFDRKEVMLLLGKEMGVKKGTIFEISLLDETKIFDNHEIDVPGRSVALVRVMELSGDANRSQIVRRWGKIKKGYKATEKTHFIPAFYLTGSLGADQNDFNIGGGINFNPFNKTNFKIGVQIGSAQDSRNNHDFILGVPFGLTTNIIHTPSFTLGGTINLHANAVFRQDDDNHSASAFYGVPKIGAETTFMTSPHRDWILGIEYAVGSITGGWGYTEGERDNVDTAPAIWDSKMGPSPTINPSGLFLTVGIRFLNF